MPNGFTIMFGGGGGDMTELAEGGDPERDAAKAALRRFRNAESEDEALDAFRALCRWADREGEGY